MMQIENVDVRKLSPEQRKKLIEDRVAAGWVYNGSWDLDIHQWLTFVWSADSPPPEK